MFQRRMELQMFLHEHPRKSQYVETEVHTTIATPSDGFKHKTKMCDTCPHRLTVQNCSLTKYIRMRKLLDTIQQHGAHPCHEDDGCFCVGSVQEKF